MKKCVLVTGANGFIGRSLAQYLRKEYPSVKVVRTDAAGSLPSRGFYLCNINNGKKLKAILLKWRPQVIFHLAGGRLESLSKMMTANVKTTRTLLDTIRSIEGYSPRVIIPGTAAEYGDISHSRKAIAESCRPRPSTPYGRIKLMQTELGLRYALEGMDIVVARIFNIMGAGIPSTLAVGNFVKELVEIENGRNRKAIRTRSLDGRRDFLDIKDVCRALWLVARRGRKGEIYNVCSGRAVSIRDLLGRLLWYSKLDDVRIREDKAASSLSFSTVGSNQKIKKATGWAPCVGIDRSLQNTLRFYRKSIK